MDGEESGYLKSRDRKEKSPEGFRLPPPDNRINFIIHYFRSAVKSWQEG